MWDLIVSVPDHCLSFYYVCTCMYSIFMCTKEVYLVAQSVECPLLKPDVTVRSQSDIPKSLKMVQAAPRLALRLTGKS